MKFAYDAAADRVSRFTKPCIPPAKRSLTNPFPDTSEDKKNKEYCDRIAAAKVAMKMAEEKYNQFVQEMNKTKSKL